MHTEPRAGICLGREGKKSQGKQLQIYPKSVTLRFTASPGLRSLCRRLCKTILIRQTPWVARGSHMNCSLRTKFTSNRSRSKSHLLLNQWLYIGLDKLVQLSSVNVRAKRRLQLPVHRLYFIAAHCKSPKYRTRQANPSVLSTSYSKQVQCTEKLLRLLVPSLWQRQTS